MKRIFLCKSVMLFLLNTYAFAVTDDSLDVTFEIVSNSNVELTSLANIQEDANGYLYDDDLFEISAFQYNETAANLHIQISSLNGGYLVNNSKTLAWTDEEKIGYYLKNCSSITTLKASGNPLVISPVNSFADDGSASNNAFYLNSPHNLYTWTGLNTTLMLSSGTKPKCGFMSSELGSQNHLVGVYEDTIYATIVVS